MRPATAPSLGSREVFLSSGRSWPFLPSGRAGRPLTGTAPFLSVPDGVSFGVLPPAGDFLDEQKVTKNSLRTKVLRTPFVDYQDRVVREAFGRLLYRCSVPRGPSSVTAPPRHLPPGGKALVWCNCRNPYHHQGSALKRGNRGTPTPLHPSAVKASRKMGQTAHNRPKGVLRTLVLS